MRLDYASIVDIYVANNVYLIRGGRSGGFTLYQRAHVGHVGHILATVPHPKTVKVSNVHRIHVLQCS